MGVKIADKLEQFNNGTYMLMDASAVEYQTQDGNSISVQEALDNGAGVAVDLSGYTKTYTSLSELGLTEPVSVGEIFNAMDDNTTTMIACEDIAINVTDVPMSYGILTIKKKNTGRFSIEYQNSLGGNATNVRRWIGTVKGNDGTGLYWKEMQATNGEIITSDIITKYGTEILKYPIGTWRIDSTNIGKQFTDLPYGEMAGVIEIDSIQPNKSPYEHSYGYRNYTFRDALNNTVYTRSLNSGNTIGTMSRDSGWCATGSHFYKLSQMWLSSNATFQDVVDKLPTGSSALFNVKEFTNYQTIFPYEEGNDQFARVHIVKGVADGSCMYARWFRKDGSKEAIAIFNTNDNKFNGWQMLKNQQIYTSLKDLGLDTTAKINDIIGAMKDGTTFTYKTDVFDYATEYNNIQYGTVTINKQHSSRVQALMTDKDTGNLYVGRLNASNQIVGWTKMITEKSDPYTCTSYKALTGTEDLFTLPCGHYVSATISTAYNYPVTDSSNATAHIYVLGHLNEPANNKGYRIILYSDNKNRMYSINEWWGSFANGWQKIATQKDLDDLFQSVSSGKTLVANAITGKGVSTATNETFATMASNINRITNYTASEKLALATAITNKGVSTSSTASFSTMATNISKITTSYKEETVTAVCGNSSSPTLTSFIFSGKVIGVKQIKAPSSDYNGTYTTNAYGEVSMITITDKYVQLYLKGSGTWTVTALIQN